MAFIPLTDDERTAMLHQVGVASVDDLFVDIPADFRFPQIDIAPGITELEVLRQMSDLAARNRHVRQQPTFIGAGAYDHFIPSIVNHVLARNELYTAYTPYQAEMSQGTLQFMFEFQSLMCDLLEMDVANSSVYDGASGLAEAVLMALRITGRDRVVLAASVYPEYRQVVETYLEGRDLHLVSPAPMRDGDQILEPSVLDVLDETTACIVVQQPSFFGTIQDLTAIQERAEAVGALFIIVTGDPVSLGLIKTPGYWGADIAVGEGQGLGVHLQYGGPWVGYMACKQKHLRQLPGRIVGQASDDQGRRGFVLTLQAREQHIRREKATSNICTSQTLLSIAVTAYLTAMGPNGLRSAARLSHARAAEAAERIAQIPGYRVISAAPFFNEFVVLGSRPAHETQAMLLQRNIIAGYPLGSLGADFEPCLLLCCTEVNTSEQIDQLVSGLTEIGSVR
ncbi:MAG: aminomethyl-transferring glycine dehydrogenase subunit GcvPA [Chloroflexota bacterium]